MALAAAVGAGAAVAAPVLLHRAEEAESGKRITECAVDEALEFKAAAALDDRGDLLDAEFAGKNNAGEAQLLERQHAFEVVGDELSRRMKRQTREIRLAQTRDTEVLDDEGRRADGLEFGEFTDGAFDVVLVDDRIDGHIDLLALRPRDTDEVLQVVRREVLRKGTGRIGGETAVNGIRPRRKGGESGFEIPCRGKQFNTHAGLWEGVQSLRADQRLEKSSVAK